MLIVALILLSIFLFILFFLRQPKFGRPPRGERLARIKASPNYKNGAFQNLSMTPQLTEGTSMFSVVMKFFFLKKERNKPAAVIPSVKTDLINLDQEKNLLVWFGHSSYFMQLDGKRFLVDPVLSGHASPLSFGTQAFDGADIYKPGDIPTIDCLFLTHDHWDHLDYDSLRKLEPKIKKIVCALGVGEHLEYWAFSKDIITELDWNEETILGNGFVVHAIPARHFSGRGLKRNQSLWTSFVLQTPSKKIFVGGDSGYDEHFEKAGKKFGPFDLAVLENGQYDKGWKYIHMMPEEVLVAAKDLHAKKLLAVHSSKFAISLHAWDEPLSKITELNRQHDLALLTPMVGELVDLDDDRQVFNKWWEQVG